MSAIFILAIRYTSAIFILTIRYISAIFEHSIYSFPQIFQAKNQNLSLFLQKITQRLFKICSFYIFFVLLCEL